jgi:hypothetical protein
LMHDRAPRSRPIEQMGRVNRTLKGIYEIWIQVSDRVDLKRS